jgi:hypothetical protein
MRATPAKFKSVRPHEPHNLLCNHWIQSFALISTGQYWEDSSKLEERGRAASGALQKGPHTRTDPP